MAYFIFGICCQCFQNIIDFILNKQFKEEETIKNINFISHRKSPLLFLFAQNLSTLGSTITSFSAIWYISLKTNTGLWMTLATCVNLLPSMLVSLYSGVLIERFGTKKVFKNANIAVLITTLIMGILCFANEKINLILLLLLLCVRSIGVGIVTPTVGTILYRLTEREKLNHYNGINQAMIALSTIISPILGGLILQDFGPGPAFIFDSLITIVGLLLFSLVKLDQETQVGLKKNTVFKKLKLTYTQIHASINLHTLFLFTICFCFLMAPVSYLSNTLIQHEFGKKVLFLTFSEVGLSIGELLGAIAIIIMSNKFNEFAKIFSSSLIIGILLIFLTIVPNIYIYSLTMTIIGFLVSFILTSLNVIIQKSEPKNMAQIFAMQNFVMTGGIPLGMIIFGPIGDLIGIRSAFIISGLLLFIVGVLFMIKKSKSRKGMNEINE